jgi:small subunit ribosomal protein S16
MATVLRLARRGKKHRPFYHVVATNSRNPRDGKHNDHCGIYDPLGAQQVVLDHAKIKYWLGVGAKASDRVLALVKRAGVFAPEAAAPATTASN